MGVLNKERILYFVDGFFDSPLSDALQSSLWIILPCLWVYKFASLFIFWSWLFVTLFALCFAFSYVLKNPMHKYGDLYGMVLSITKKIK